MYELVVIWNDGTKDIYTYNDYKTAIERQKGFEMAFGGQVWCCVRDKIR